MSKRQPDLSCFTPRAKQAIALANREAEHFNHDEIRVEHILLGIIALNEGVAVSVLRQLGLDSGALKIEIQKSVSVTGGAGVKGRRPFSLQVVKIFSLAAADAAAMNYNFIGTEHLLMAILRDGKSSAARILANMNITPDAVRKAVTAALDPEYLPEEEETPANPAPAGRAAASGSLPALNAFGRNLTRLAREGRLDPVVGREKEIRRVIQILCRRTKNNPVLIGEAGVGKTAVVEALAQAVASGDVPENIADREIYALDLPLMVAGTKYRGQFEERIKAVIDEVRTSGKVIVFIDELHTIVGAGGGEGGMDAANIIKPALARGEMQCVGATTLDEYRKGIEKDPALERRFQPVIVDAPDVQTSVAILEGLKKTYEKHHRVTYSREALAEAVRLSDRYITGRHLPDKAIDIMDEAGARARISAMRPAPDVSDLEEKLQSVREQKESAVAGQDFEQAAALRDQERSVKKEISDRISAWQRDEKRRRVPVNVDDIRSVVADLSGVPLQQMDDGESSRLLNMEKIIGESVIGQEDAVSAVSRALRRSRADLRDPARPVGSFIFLGPTGVGKTLLAKKLAGFIFGTEDALVQIDMSEYMEKFNTSRLVGSPPGYVGHGEGGELTEKIRRRPYSVVLFDEIEKAHPDVLHMLLQILEDGHITDSLGRKIDFRNTVIIMTSNAGVQNNTSFAPLGFAAGGSLDAARQAELIRAAAGKKFRPEFLNRVDEIITFRNLDSNDLVRILDLEISKLAGRLAANGLTLSVSQEVKEILCNIEKEKNFGARPLRRAVERYIEDMLSAELLQGTFRGKSRINVKLSGGKVTFTATGRKKSDDKRGK